MEGKERGSSRVDVPKPRGVETGRIPGNGVSSGPERNASLTALRHTDHQSTAARLDVVRKQVQDELRKVREGGQPLVPKQGDDSRSGYDRAYEKFRQQEGEPVQHNYQIERTFEEDLQVKENAVRNSQRRIAENPSLRSGEIQQILDEEYKRASYEFFLRNQERATHLISVDGGKSWLDAKGVEAGRNPEAIFFGEYSLAQEVGAGQLSEAMTTAQESPNIFSAIGDITKASTAILKEALHKVKKYVNSQDEEEEAISKEENERRKRLEMMRRMDSFIAQIILLRLQKGSSLSTAQPIGKT